MEKADIGLIGLAVMGENLAMNMESRGFRVAVYNRSADKVTRFLEGRAKGRNIVGAASLQELVDSLKKPRKIMMMVKAGQPVDELIDALIPLLDKGDILIDGGNSHFADTIRRTKYVEEKGLLYIGTGVSGGEEGALRGPSIMPGGSPAAWEYVKPIFQAIAARVEDSTPCCDWVGSDGAGHFVKMVHNGIEYGDMQLICEAYHLMKDVLGLSAFDMHEVFREWNEGELDSYLIEITGEILAHKDVDGRPLVDQILDTAGQKGTGKWTSVAALDEGVPLTLISEAVYARYLSAMKDERVSASKVLPGPEAALGRDKGKAVSGMRPGCDAAVDIDKGVAGLEWVIGGDKKAFIEDIRKALYASKIISYAQGYALMQAAAKTYGWDLNYGEIALLWRGGCIIRSAFLGRIKEAFDRDFGLRNLLLDPFFQSRMEEAQASWRRVVATAVMHGVPVPAFAAALSYYDGYRSERLPANLLQAQRDYFGAHTYERIDRPRGERFHTDWTGRGGSTAATTYNA